MKLYEALYLNIRTALVIVLLTALTGCATYGGGAGYAGGYDDNGPDMYLFGGGYDNGREVHNFSHRGSVSRGAVHSGGNSHAAHASGGGGVRR